MKIYKYKDPKTKKYKFWLYCEKTNILRFINEKWACKVASVCKINIILLPYKEFQEFKKKCNK